MADIRELFSILDAGSGVGSAPDQCIDATTAAASKKGLIGFSFKDSSGNVILPALTAAGKISVDVGAAGTAKKAHGELAAGSASIVLVTGAVITLLTTKLYSEIQWNVTCRTAALFQLIWNDNGAETILDEAICGPGQFSHSVPMGCVAITSGATGTQELKVKAKNFEVNSSLRATLCAIEAA